MNQKKLRIALDARALTGRFTGDRTYWLNLTRSLAILKESSDIEFLLYTRTPIPIDLLPESPNLKQIVLPASNDRVWTLATLPLALRKAGADLLHVQYTTPIPGLCPCPVVTTVHDITFKLFPEWYGAKDRLLLNLTVPLALKQATRIITVSNSSREDILKTYSVSPSKVVATPLGLPEEFVSEIERQKEVEVAEPSKRLLEKYGVEPPFVLSVGVLQPRKNNRLLIEAFAKAKTKFHLPHKLYFIGKLGWKTDLTELKEVARRNGGDEAVDAIQFPGYVEDSDLPALYRTCDLFAHSALYEGFGIPPLEAMACGAPVLVSDAPALPEVVGNAAKIVPSNDVDAWVEALGELLQNAELRKSYSERGKSRAKLFRWEDTAKQTLKVYLEAIETKARK